MPDFIPGPLQKEVEIGGRKVALWVPAAGGLLAIGVFALYKLRSGGGGGGGSGAASSGAEMAATQAAAAETNAFTSALEQVKKTQTNINEQVARVQEGFAGTQARVEEMGAQITGFQAQIGEQAQALQAGIAGVSTAQAAFKSDIEARIAQVENSMANLRKDVDASKADFSPRQKYMMAQAFSFIGERMFNPIAAELGVPTWQFKVSAQSGAIEAKPSTPGGYYAPLWGV